MILLVLSCVFVPTFGRFIIVSAGIHDAVTTIIVGQEAAISFTAKGKLQYLHPGKIESIS